MSDTPRTDELSRDHYYESAAEAAGMVVSAKSLEDCYREMRSLACELERELNTHRPEGGESKDAIIEQCARELEREIEHIKRNAASLRKFPGHDDEARARELGAMYLKEAAWNLRMSKSDSPLMKALDGLGTEPQKLP